jgi:D-lactate dehydrogenase
VLAYDPYVNKDVEKLPFVQYVSQEELFRQSDLISVHVPLMPSTQHFLNKYARDEIE